MQINWAQFVAFIGYNIDLTAFLAGLKYVAIGKTLAIHQEPYTITMQNWKWLLVVELLLIEGMEIYTYYYMVPERRIIVWPESVNGYILFQECMVAWHWNHKKLELEAQYW
ncbi:hypothetical protein EDD22DRAFT_845372 [Suillus occidentalis]|nr:hypothetical protein EDD22DRAFT_845372 [Suillus occidentalis]